MMYDHKIKYWFPKIITPGNMINLLLLCILVLTILPVAFTRVVLLKKDFINREILPASNKSFALYLLLIFNLFIVFPGVAQVDSNQFVLSDTIEFQGDFFDIEAPFDCTLEFDIKEYQRSKNKGQYLPAKLSFYDQKDSLITTRQVRLKARGNFRRDHCSLPPLWLNIKKAKIAGEEFENVNKMKIVTHCRMSSTYQSVIMKEFLAYNIYRVISPYSFRVRLMEIRYIDTGRKNKEYTDWAFVIEPEAMMAERLDAFPFKYDNISRTQTRVFETDVMSIFQYMIGNADYSIMARHNTKLIKLNDLSVSEPIPVPYDFDYTGIVNAPYAEPGENLPIEKITDRYFLGPCRTREEFQNAIDVFIQKKENINEVVNSFPYANAKTKKDVIDYLNEFYNQLEKSWFIEFNLESTCLKKSMDN